jgi:hypothetical protein
MLRLKPDEVRWRSFSHDTSDDIFPLWVPCGRSKL